MSQEDLAHRANIDRSYMGGVERGERNLSFKKAVRDCANARTPSDKDWRAKAWYLERILPENVGPVAHRIIVK
jgi:transcriptional regulator with XRE-family HTH domain